MRLLLVDGHYYLYRSFFAIRGLSNSKGEPTNALYGFSKALRKMVTDLKPELTAVIWDAGLPARRTELQPEYKQQRPEMPDDLKRQEPQMEALAPLLGFRSLSLPNVEADDLIASYAVAARALGHDVIIATSDKDILQMVDARVSVYSTAKADVADPNAGFALLGPEEVARKWGVAAEQIGEVLALTGDASDNIPGVAGVGGKTASRLIQTFGSVEGLLSRLSEVENEKLRIKLEEAKELVRQNRQMVRLDQDLPLPVPVDELTYQPDYPALIQAFSSLEFKSLKAEIEREAQAVVGKQGELF